MPEGITKEDLRKVQRQIKAALYVKEKGNITSSIYQSLNDIGKTVATNELRELVEKGILAQTGTKGRGSNYFMSR